jgi:hypothetical protein
VEHRGIWDNNATPSKSRATEALFSSIINGSPLCSLVPLGLAENFRRAWLSIRRKDVL